MNYTTNHILHLRQLGHRNRKRHKEPLSYIDYAWVIPYTAVFFLRPINPSKRVLCLNFYVPLTRYASVYLEKVRRSLWPCNTRAADSLSFGKQCIFVGFARTVWSLRRGYDWFVEQVVRLLCNNNDEISPIMGFSNEHTGYSSWTSCGFFLKQNLRGASCLPRSESN